MVTARQAMMMAPARWVMTMITATMAMTMMMVMGQWAMARRDMTTITMATGDYNNKDYGDGATGDAVDNDGNGVTQDKNEDYIDGDDGDDGDGTTKG